MFEGNGSMQWSLGLQLGCDYRGPRNDSQSNNEILRSRSILVGNIQDSPARYQNEYGSDGRRWSCYSGHTPSEIDDLTRRNWYRVRTSNDRSSYDTHGQFLAHMV